MRREGRKLLIAGMLLCAAGRLLQAQGLVAAARPTPAPDAPAPQSSPANGGEVLLREIQGGIGPATRDYLQRGLARMAAGNVPAVVVRIDTPGGLDVVGIIADDIEAQVRQADGRQVQLRTGRVTLATAGRQVTTV